jgi:hypothetical protein
MYINEIPLKKQFWCFLLCAINLYFP